MNLELSLFCKTCNSSNLERVLPPKSKKLSERDICPECGIYTERRKKMKIQRDHPNEPSYVIPEVTNPIATSSSRAKVRKWKFKQYTEESAEDLGLLLVDWARTNHQETTLTKFLVDVGQVSYSKLCRMAENCQDLADALDLTKEIFAERIRQEWKQDEKMDINKYAPKMFDLMSPIVKLKEDKKLKVELSTEKGIPYHDPTYPNLLTKSEQ